MLAISVFAARFFYGAARTIKFYDLIYSGATKCALI